MASATVLVLVAAVAAGAAAWVVLAGPPPLAGGRAAGRPRTRAPAKETSTPSTVTMRAAAAVGGGAAGLLLVPGVAGVVMAAVAAGVVWWRSQGWETAGVQRRRERLAADLPHVVDLLVASLDAGASPERALDRVARVVGGPVAEELQPWLSHLRLGSDPAGVWSRMAAHPELGRLGRALHRATESGAPVAAALARLSEDLRSRARLEVEAKVRQVEVKAAVPLAVCLLPAFLLLGVVPLIAGSVSGLVLTP